MPSNTSKPFLCGVIEGFYGKPWTMKQRADLFPRIEQFGMDTYLYAPKDDFKHRAAWRVPYSPPEAEQLRRLIAESKLHNIKFIYALSPGIDMIYSSEKEMTLLKNKLDQVVSLGCLSFALLFDDIEPELRDEDREMFKTFANAQAHVTNEIYHHLKAPSLFMFCPTEYCEAYCQPSFHLSTYLPILGQELNLGIEILWTGPRVISKHISVASIKAVNKVLRRPVTLWDNFHANDYDQRRIFLGPYCGRSPELVPLLGGVLTNPNCEFEMNWIPMHTLATWSKSSNLKSEISDGGECDGDISEDTYNPAKALASAINDWLPRFSISQSSLTEIPLIVKSDMGLEPMEAEVTADKNNTDSEEQMSVGSESEKKLPPSPDLSLDICQEGMLEEDCGVTVDDLYLMVDLCYLPYQHGPRAVGILQELSWLVNYHSQLSSCTVDTTSSLAEEWKLKAASFTENIKAVDRLLTKIDGPNRSINYEIQPYLSEIRHALHICARFIRQIDPEDKTDAVYEPKDPEPWVFHGGFGAELQRILPPEAFKSDQVTLKRPVENPSASTCVYFVRPYCSQDKEALYSICLLNSDNGQDGSHLFPDHPELIGDRGVGPYLEFASDLAYVLADDEGICGYVLAAVDTQQFYDNFHSLWLPQICEKYPAPTTDRTTWTYSEEVTYGFHNPPKVVIPECLSGPYPSHLKFNLLPRAQGKGMGEGLITCVLAALQQKGSKGVHLDIAPNVIRYLNFYTSLGFTEITMDTPQPLNQVFLGKSFPATNS